MKRVAIFLAVLFAVSVGVGAYRVMDHSGDRVGNPVSGALASASVSRPHHHYTAPVYPNQNQVRKAKKFARKRAGNVSFAVLGARGGIRGRGVKHSYPSASVSKSLMLAAYLHSHKHLDPGVRSLLDPMIRYSDNNAASAVYNMVGDTGLRKVARRAGMKHLGLVGYWANVGITPADMVRFMYRLPKVIGKRHHHLGYAKHLLAGISEGQRWGIPPALGHRWKPYFKGGWRPSCGYLVHQISRLVYKHTVIAIAVETDCNPGMAYGEETITGIARRLTHPPPRARKN